MHTYIIAEAGVNHNGDLKLALQLIDVAVAGGADAVKFQTFFPEKLASMNAPKAVYQKNSMDGDESQLNMLRKLSLSKKDYSTLKAYCEEKNIEFLSSPFDLNSVSFLLDDLKLTRIKIPSGEITTGPLLLHIAQSQVPVILSTGMSTLADIENALSVLAFGYTKQLGNPTLCSLLKAYRSTEGQQALREKVTLLHCTSAYPASLDNVNLRAMDTLRSAFNLSVGYSDHTEGVVVSIAAVARGATVIEKHFTLDKSLPGPDHKASLEPNELKNMVEGIRAVERAMGNSIKAMTTEELDTKNVARKSLIATQIIKCDELFSENNIDTMRPGTGISAMHYWQYIGQKATREYKNGELIDG